LPDGWADGDASDLFLGGTFRYTGEHGMLEILPIIKIVSTNVVQLGRQPRGLTAGTEVEVVKGCDHTMAGCASHDNLPNYGGHPDIPTESPFGLRNNYY
jgi:hypothetical protein